MLGRVRNILISTVTLWLLTAAGTSHALNIDFRDPDVWDGYGDATYSSGGITVDANGNLLYRDDTDGYGILGGEWDEVDREEMLTVWFDESFFDNADNWLTGVLLTDLFPAPDGGAAGESGWVTLFDSLGNMITEFYVNATEYVANGEYFVDFGGAFAPDHVTFTAYLGPDNVYTGSEFSVAGFRTSVPEPGTLALLGVGLLMIAYARRRRPLRAI